MTADVIIEFRRRPSVLAYMLRGLYQSPGVHGTGGGPAIRARWRSHRVDRRHLAEFLQLSGLPADPRMPILFPHVFSFPLQMAVLTHPRCPVPLRLNATTEADRTVFGVFLDGEERPAILASWRSGEVAGPLFDNQPTASRQLLATR